MGLVGGAGVVVRGVGNFKIALGPEGLGEVISVGLACGLKGNLNLLVVPDGLLVVGNVNGYFGRIEVLFPNNIGRILFTVVATVGVVFLVGVTNGFITGVGA